MSPVDERGRRRRVHHRERSLRLQPSIDRRGAAVLGAMMRSTDLCQPREAPRSHEVARLCRTPSRRRSDRETSHQASDELRERPKVGAGLSAPCLEAALFDGPTAPPQARRPQYARSVHRVPVARTDSIAVSRGVQPRRPTRVQLACLDIDAACLNRRPAGQSINILRPPRATLGPRTSEARWRLDETVVFEKPLAGGFTPAKQRYRLTSSSDKADRGAPWPLGIGRDQGRYVLRG